MKVILAPWRSVSSVLNTTLLFECLHLRFGKRPNSTLRRKNTFPFIVRWSAVSGGIKCDKLITFSTLIYFVKVALDIRLVIRLIRLIPICFPCEFS